MASIGRMDELTYNKVRAKRFSYGVEPKQFFPDRAFKNVFDAEFDHTLARPRSSSRSP